MERASAFEPGPCSPIGIDYFQRENESTLKVGTDNVGEWQSEQLQGDIRIPNIWYVHTSSEPQPRVSSDHQLQPTEYFSGCRCGGFQYDESPGGYQTLRYTSKLSVRDEPMLFLVAMCGRLLFLELCKNVNQLGLKRYGKKVALQARRP